MPGLTVVEVMEIFFQDRSQSAQVFFLSVEEGAWADVSVLNAASNKIRAINNKWS